MCSCTSTKFSSAQKQELESKIIAKNYSIVIDKASPIRMPQIHLSSEYSFKIHGDSATTYLPYYGNASVAPFDANELAVSFSNIITNYSQKRNKKNDGWEMKFSVKSNIKLYQVFLSVYDNGRSNITISSYDRDSISYLGEVELSR